MKTLICLALAFGPVFAGDRIEHAHFQVQSFGYQPNVLIGPGLIQGILGVGHTVTGVPCGGGCFGIPNNSIVVPEPTQIYYPGQNVTYYATLQSGNMGGTANVTLTIAQGSTTIQTFTGQVGITPRSVNLFSFPAQTPTVTGLVTITLTTTLNGVTVQGVTVMEVQ